jgi:ubiquinone/menaquinone biosynthesis C-methylase UbiE
VSAVGPEGFVVGVDPSLAMLQPARRRAAHLVARMAPGLPFPDETFDVVLANLVLSHFTDTAAGTAELVRVLRRRGRVGVTAWPENRDEPESDGRRWESSRRHSTTPGWRWRCRRRRHLAKSG